MKYEIIKGLKTEDFRKLMGTKIKTFEKMVEIVTEAHRMKKLKEEKTSFL